MNEQEQRSGRRRITGPDRRKSSDRRIDAATRLLVDTAVWNGIMVEAGVEESSDAMARRLIRGFIKLVREPR
jgi:hypothetical protein